MKTQSTILFFILSIGTLSTAVKKDYCPVLDGCSELNCPEGPNQQYALSECPITSGCAASSCPKGYKLVDITFVAPASGPESVLKVLNQCFGASYAPTVWIGSYQGSTLGPNKPLFMGLTPGCSHIQNANPPTVVPVQWFYSLCQRE